MWKTILAVLALLAFLMSYAAFAESKAPGKSEDPIDAWMGAAMNQAVSTPEMVAVYTQAAKKWDDRLNQVYKACLAKLKTSQDQAALKEAQKKWLAFRDAERELIIAVCHFSPDGAVVGTIAQVISNDKFVELLRQRVLQLEDYLKILEGKGNL